MSERVYWYAGRNPAHKSRRCVRIFPWYKWPKNQLVRWLDDGHLCIVPARALRRERAAIGGGARAGG